MISSQRPWPLDHEAGLSDKYRLSDKTIILYNAADYMPVSYGRTS